MHFLPYLIVLLAGLAIGIGLTFKFGNKSEAYAKKELAAADADVKRVAGKL